MRKATFVACACPLVSVFLLVGVSVFGQYAPAPQTRVSGTDLTVGSSCAGVPNGTIITSLASGNIYSCVSGLVQLGGAAGAVGPTGAQGATGPKGPAPCTTAGGIYLNTADSTPGCDAPNFFWDFINKRLGIGVTPAVPLDVNGNAYIRNQLYTNNIASFGAPPLNILSNISGIVDFSASSFSGVGSVPTISGCAAGTQVGGNTIGSFASGTTGVCTVTLTFLKTATNAWFCDAQDLTTFTSFANIFHQTGGTTTSAIISSTTVTGDVVKFACFAY